MRLGAAAAAPPGNLLPEGVEGSAHVSLPADAVTASPPVGGQIPLRSSCSVAGRAIPYCLCCSCRALLAGPIDLKHTSSLEGFSLGVPARTRLGAVRKSCPAFAVEGCKMARSA